MIQYHIQDKQQLFFFYTRETNAKLILCFDNKRKVGLHEFKWKSNLIHKVFYYVTFVNNKW